MRQLGQRACDWRSHCCPSSPAHPPARPLLQMNPFCIPFAINNMGGAMLAMDLGFMGPNYSISTACATGNFCILK